MDETLHRLLPNPSMNPLEGVWILEQASAWDEAGKQLADPYGSCPMGSIVFKNGRMIASLCNGDTYTGMSGKREYSSYGGSYTFDGQKLDVSVDIASEPNRIGGNQIREVLIEGERLTLRPPLRAYGGSLQQRELVWRRVVPVSGTK
ncbi:MAG: hypothetical protein EBU84_04245 [Actinobacteria bacterium]|nr:hypothetical protein [Actinomycetota bacterium]